MDADGDDSNCTQNRHMQNWVINIGRTAVLKLKFYYVLTFK